MDLYLKNPEFELAKKICQTLQAKGFQALLAGGCVRDFLLKRQPNDFDVATSATPDQVEALFSKTIAVGKNFGVIVVIDGDQQVEVATFRKDGPYKDGRRPETVEFSEAKEDAERRDFTVNGLFYDLQTQQVIDYIGGEKDLWQKSIRAIGNAGKRFEEDHLRLLRAVRFAAQLGFQIESETLRALEASRSLIATVSGERIQEEMRKLLTSPDPLTGLEILYRSGLLASLLSEENLRWIPPDNIWRRQEKTDEDSWYRFFLWLKSVLAPVTPIKEFEALCDRWKFSKDLKQKTLKALQWSYEEKPFATHSLGELLSLSYEPEQLRGLLESAEQNLQLEEKLKFEEFQKRRQELGPQKPKPWVTASDLIDKLQGEALGQALKACYWEQLEGKVKNKEDLIEKWRK
ncbi:MAG: CCA tRNA nucleotidyltransferase [Pseudobdellovibrionaceae bacterium]